MSVKQQREASRQIRALRAEWKGWATGQFLPWGTPWCSRSCGDSTCEGCATRAYVRVQLDRIEAQAGEVAS